jgi:hypothetical protein
MFLRKGLPIEPAGGSAAARKRQERELDRLRDSVAFSRTGGRRTHWKLRDAADWRLRRIATSGDFPEMTSALTALAIHEKHAEETGDNLVPETWLAGAEWGAPEAAVRLLHLEEVFAPALCRGLTTAWSDREGRVAYALTAAGREFLRSPVAPRVRWPNFSPEAVEHYAAARADEEERLAVSIPSLTGHVAIPLSAGAWPEDSERAPIPPIFKANGEIRTPAELVGTAKGGRRR